MYTHSRNDDRPIHYKMLGQGIIDTDEVTCLLCNYIACSCTFRDFMAHNLTHSGVSYLVPTNVYKTNATKCDPRVSKQNSSSFVLTLWYDCLKNGKVVQNAQNVQNVQNILGKFLIKFASGNVCCKPAKDQSWSLNHEIKYDRSRTVTKIRDEYILGFFRWGGSPQKYDKERAVEVIRFTNRETMKETMCSFDKELKPNDFKDSQSVLQLAKRLGGNEIMTTKLPEVTHGTFGAFKWSDSEIPSQNFSCGRCDKSFSTKKKRTQHECTVCKYCSKKYANRKECAEHENSCEIKANLRRIFGVYVKPSIKIGYNTFCWQGISFHNKLLLPKALPHTKELSGLKFYTRIYLPAYIISMSTFHEIMHENILRDPGIPFLNVRGEKVDYRTSTNCLIINEIFQKAISAETSALRERCQSVYNPRKISVVAKNNIATGSTITEDGCTGKGLIGIRNRISKCLLVLHSSACNNTIGYTGEEELPKPAYFRWSSRPPSCPGLPPPTIDMSKILNCTIALSRCGLKTVDSRCDYCANRPDALNKPWARFATMPSMFATMPPEFPDIIKWLNSEERYNGSIGQHDEVCCDCALLHVVKETVNTGKNT